MDILVTFDENYIPPFKTMLKSLMINNPDQNITFWLIHDGIKEKQLQDLICFCLSYGAKFEHICISKNYFEDAKTTKRYPQSMYYRLLAPLILPETLDRILYLDPDILVINGLDNLWKTEFPAGKFYAASSHAIFGSLTDDINKIRLDTDHSYFNTGVILMDLKKARKIVNVDEIIRTVNQSRDIELILPDQDIFNTMYGKYTLEIPEELYNYDARFYFAYLLNSSNEHDLDWVMSNTCILHFCGKKKPWLSQGYDIFSSLYKYFMYK
ncbi:MAG: glycosyltransferase family 8 protein [Erysipelotrichaceae bacterium]|jgi:lipopolysaccharide biosynthesis glycosyltransferase